MALTTVDFKTTFQFGATPKTFEFIDQTDYAGQSVALVDADGIFTIVDPLGNTIYNNTDYSSPDIDPNVSLTNSTTILLPLDGSGKVIQGQYTITYTVRDTGGAPDYASLVKTFTLAYASPTISLVLTADCVKPLLKSTDDTNYTINSVDPSIVRDHKILYPPSVSQPDVTGTGSALETSVFYTIKGSTLQHTSTLASTVTYDFGSDFFVTDSISGQDENDVSCDGQLCDIYCCVRSEWNRYTSNVNVNETAANLHLDNWIQMTSLMEKIRVALECGKGTDVSEYTARIQKLGNCESGCDCDDGTPQLVTGLGGGTGVVIVDSGGTPVTVTSVVAGGTTTYTVTMDAAFVTKANSQYNTTVTAGTAITVSVAPDADGNKTYTINAAQAPIVEILSFLVDIDLTADSLPTVTVSDISRQGTAFNNVDPLVENQVSPASAFINQSTDFLITNVWLSQGSLQYKPDIHIIDKVGCQDADAPNVLVERFDNNQTDISFRFLTFSGQKATGYVINQYDNIQLQVTLTA